MENTIITPKRNTPRDVFLHLLGIITLYWSAISIITLCWQYINYWFPDALKDVYYNYGFNGSIRFAVSSLIIVFPVFLLTSWFLNRIYQQESMVRDSRIRKWLIYLTLFAAALVIIGDLIFVINTFLGGEITVRFILKALSVVIVAAVVFGYYLDDVRRQSAWPKAKYIAWGSGAVVVALVVGAFFTVGSPMTARNMQFDQTRTSDLENIQYQVVNYWQRKGTMPNTLADLQDSISGYVAPTDPQTKQPYEYIVTDAANMKFQLCATFSLPSMQNAPKAAPVYYTGGLSQNWDHAAGHVCFERTIDRQLYPPMNK